MCPSFTIIFAHVLPRYNDGAYWRDVTERSLHVRHGEYVIAGVPQRGGTLLHGGTWRHHDDNDDDDDDDDDDAADDDDNDDNNDDYEVDNEDD